MECWVPAQGDNGFLKVNPVPVSQCDHVLFEWNLNSLAEAV